MSIVSEDLYPSRVANEPSIQPRLDPVLYCSPDAKTPPGLTREMVMRYERDGFLFIPELFTKHEVERFRGEMERLGSEEKLRERDLVVTEPDSNEVRSVFWIHRVSELFHELSHDPRIVRIIGHLLNSDLYLHQSRVNFKPGFTGKEFYWHSDFETWHVEDGMPYMRAISCSISLTDNNPFNGPLMLVPGSHRKYVSCVGATPENNYARSLKRQEVGVPDRESLRTLVDEGGIEAPTGRAGSVTLFECNTMHGSSGNISPFPRSNVFFVYNSIENQLVDPFGETPPRPEHLADRGDDLDVIKRA